MKFHKYGISKIKDWQMNGQAVIAMGHLPIGKAEIMIYAKSLTSCQKQMSNIWHVIRELILLFVSHSGMKERGLTCKFNNAQSKNKNKIQKNKKVEFNPYIHTLSKLSRFGYEISVFITQQGYSE